MHHFKVYVNMLVHMVTLISIKQIKEKCLPKIQTKISNYLNLGFSFFILNLYWFWIYYLKLLDQ